MCCGDKDAKHVCSESIFFSAGRFPRVADAGESSGKQWMWLAFRLSTSAYQVTLPPVNPPNFRWGPLAR